MDDGDDHQLMSKSQILHKPTRNIDNSYYVDMLIISSSALQLKSSELGGGVASQHFSTHKTITVVLLNYIRSQYALQTINFV